MAETTTKDQLRVEIKSSPKFITSPKHWDESFQEQTISFFNSKSRRKKDNTWIISLFVVLHLVVFAATMVINDCPSNSSHGHCVLRAIGRFSFQPLTENPLLGPSSATWVFLTVFIRVLFFFNGNVGFLCTVSLNLFLSF